MKAPKEKQAELSARKWTLQARVCREGQLLAEIKNEEV